ASSSPPPPPTSPRPWPPPAPPPPTSCRCRSSPPTWTATGPTRSRSGPPTGPCSAPTTRRWPSSASAACSIPPPWSNSSPPPSSPTPPDLHVRRQEPDRPLAQQPEVARRLGQAVLVGMTGVGIGLEAQRHREPAEIALHPADRRPLPGVGARQVEHPAADRGEMDLPGALAAGEGAGVPAGGGEGVVEVAGRERAGLPGQLNALQAADARHRPHRRCGPPAGRQRPARGGRVVQLEGAGDGSLAREPDSPGRAGGRQGEDAERDQRSDPRRTQPPHPSSPTGVQVRVID